MLRVSLAMPPLQAHCSTPRTASRSRESGQVVVLLLVFMVVLLGMAAFAIDVGSWYRADRALQSSVDTVVVTGKRDAPGFFSKIFGIDSVEVHARAAARAGTLEEARWAAPFGVDEQHPMLRCEPTPCFEEDTSLELDRIGPGAFRIINIDGSRGGIGPSTLEDWILRGYEGSMPLGWYHSDPGAKFNSSPVEGALDARLGTELLFPIYRETRGNGANFEYEVVGWASYVITSYDIQGSKNNKLNGYFKRVVWEGIGGDSPGSPSFGARAVSLVE